MLFHCWPTQEHLFCEASRREADSLAVVIDESARTVQIGVAPATNAVFLFQKSLCCFGIRMGRIQRGDSQLSSLKTASLSKYVFNLRIRQKERGGISPLRAPGNQSVYGFLLFLFGWKQSDLFWLSVYAYISSARIISSACAFRLFIRPTQAI